MFGIGMSEVLLIALVVLLFFGGAKIPELMKGLGKGVRSFKDGMNGVDVDAEKKAEKNQDLVKIEDKIRVNAHMLTHVKEKLAFVRRQKAARQQEEQDKDDEYAQSRAKLATARIKRDYTRDHNASLKKAS